MELFYYRDPKLNFGDDLNAVLWPRILSPAFHDAQDVVLVGIGSILTEEWLGRFANAGKRVIVLGSGTSYDRPPRAIAEWRVEAVRGPLTAAMIGMPDKAITDGAILLAAVPDLVPRIDVWTEVVFMPHHRSIRSSRWARIAAQAGMTFVTPQQPVEDVLAAFSRAKLVVTEAMHGAIVADTLRIPWVPVTISPAVDEFKWRDWTRSMELPFEPTQIPAGHPLDQYTYAGMGRVLRGAGIAGHRMLRDASSREALQSYFDRRFAPDTKAALLSTAPGRAGRAAFRLARPARRLWEHGAAEALRRAANTPAFLSEARVFENRLARMREAVDAAERFAVGGPSPAARGA